MSQDLRMMFRYIKYLFTLDIVSHTFINMKLNLYIKSSCMHFFFASAFQIFWMLAERRVIKLEYVI